MCLPDICNASNVCFKETVTVFLLTKDRHTHQVFTFFENNFIIIIFL